MLASLKLAPTIEAPRKLAPPSLARSRFDESRLASVKSEPSCTAPAVTSAPGRRSASARIVPFSFAPRKRAPRRSARSNLASLESACSKLAQKRSASLKSAPVRTLLEKLIPVSVAPWSLILGSLRPDKFWCLRSARSPPCCRGTKRSCFLTMLISSSVVSSMRLPGRQEVNARTSSYMRGNPHKVHLRVSDDDHSIGILSAPEGPTPPGLIDC